MASLTLTVLKGETLWTPEGRHVIDGSGVAKVADKDTQVTLATQDGYDRATKFAQMDRERRAPKGVKNANAGGDASTTNELLKGIEETKVAAFTAKREVEELKSFVTNLARGLDEVKAIVLPAASEDGSTASNPDPIQSANPAPASS